MQMREKTQSASQRRFEQLTVQNTSMAIKPEFMVKFGIPSEQILQAAHDLRTALNDLQRAFELAHSKPRHLVPQPWVPFAPRAGLDGVIDSLLAAQHALEMFRRTLPNNTSRLRLNRLANRLTRIVTEARKFATP